MKNKKDNIAKAITKYIRISPKKARFTASIIRGLFVLDALKQLQFSKTKASRFLAKTLKSAIANAIFKFNAKKEDLIVDQVRIDKGPTFKRIYSRNRGGRATMLKRTSHFMIVVSTK